MRPGANSSGMTSWDITPMSSMDLNLYARIFLSAILRLAVSVPRTQSRDRTSRQRHFTTTTTLAASSASSAPPLKMATSEQALLIEMAKKAAAYTAVKDHFDPRFKHVGIGSGSTVVDEDLNLIKGGGACLWQEKIVALASRTFVCVADYRKLGSRLGTSWKQGIPIEVHPMRVNKVLAALERLGSRSPAVRLDPTAAPAAAPLVTDNHMHIIDAPFIPLVLPAHDAAAGVAGDGDGRDGIWSVEKLARALKDIDGVCEIGLFYGYSGLDKPGQGGAQKPVAAYFGMADGSVQVQNQGAPPVTITTQEAA
ncbi:ribose-5-phosphate isomerase [Magnaporthiopsis poae ATCC 64411]|uniref:Ribose-5-phosphate isomerase n=1 Tax=Magnaporthiopsis poae (strain ATCC 64411 / 73-15) TaxID=644358 RepID=A0A0C4DP62_MAGP6|nr:ribose-5-phosphate isomerase [Magnaporthiopsis poae ATCC 64411]